MSSDSIAVRVRGPYATALSKLLHDEGVKITQPSKVMQERLGLEDLDLPAKATIKQADTPGLDLLIVGIPAAHDLVLGIMKKKLDLTSYATSPLQQYSTIVVEVRGEEAGKCIAEHRGIKLVLETRSCVPGKITTAYVRRAPPTPDDMPVAREGFSILLDTLILFDTGPVTFSKHIYDLERTAFLENIGLKARQKGYGLRWRSNAARAPPELIEKELEQALTKAEEFTSPLLVASISPGEVLTEGNRITLCTLSLHDKNKMDKTRMSVTPTILNHHSLKTNGPRLDQVVAYSEFLLERRLGTPQSLGQAAWEYAWQRLSETPRIAIIHSTPEARVLKLGPAHPVENTMKTMGVILERTVKQDGTYDGLQVEKRRGDVITSIIVDGAWALAHTYWSQEGRLKGIYININTPPEPGEGHVRYLDLHVDVTQVPGNPPSIIDRDKLEKSLASGTLTENLYKKALETATAIERILEDNQDKVFTSEREGVIAFFEELLARLRNNDK